MVVDIAQLSIAERLQFVENLWDSLAVNLDDIPVTQAQRDELDRRLQAHYDNPRQGASWEQVKTSIKRRARP